MKLFTPLLLIAGLFSGCAINCVTGTGPTEQQTLDLPSFNAIQVEGSLDVTVEKGSKQAVTVTGQPALIALMNTKVKGGTWHITTEKCWTTTSEFSVHIVTPSLTGIVVEGSSDVSTADVFGTGETKLSTEGSGTITVEGINEQDLDIAIAGSGGITIAGTCSKLDGSISGSGDLHAQGLTANEASLSVAGSGSATITAITSLDANVAGSGDIRYGGKPKVSSKVSGSGAVTPIP